MKVAVEWLKDFVETDSTPDEMGSVLTRLGLELESEEGGVLNFKVTPNRGDCLSILGLARELAAKDPLRFKPTALFRSVLSTPPISTDDSGIVTVEDWDNCRRYAAGMFRGVPIGSSSDAIQSRLTASGMRPINVIVDATNYVMLELGQPLHAFDFDKLGGGRIVVRSARDGEKLKTLDGVDRELKPGMLMICDAERTVAIAGVMGGQDSEVSDSTTSILLESAHFGPVSVRKTRKALGMTTEASFRFERFVDPDGAVRAIQRFAELLGRRADSIHDSYRPSERRAIEVREARWNRLLGMEVPKAAAATALNAIGCRVEETKVGLRAAPPTWRNDLTLEEDLVEEIGRLWGYDKIPEALPFGSTPQGGESPEAAIRTQARNAMLRLGFAEVANHTLTDHSPLDSCGEKVQLRNPAAPELAFLRNSILPGLARTAAKNRGRSLRLFEVGRIFSDYESRSLAFLLSGKLTPDHWKDSTGPDADFYAAKGVVEQVASLLGRDVEFEPSADRRFHPNRQAKVVAGGGCAGILGEIEVDTADSLDLPSGVLMGELNIETLFASDRRKIEYEPISQHPPVRRDLAFSIPKEISYTQIESAIQSAIGENAEEIWLFDVYEGKGIPEGEHSLGVAVLLRDRSRTLTDEEANDARVRALEAIKILGAKERT
ncbi:MAG: phenylalanine--tRNA ligase subunit beta [Armatimonadetes bacterium]|nr:phenylalanine--tRNA ligase subunit beta [Armatimonadota bacterium]